MAEFKQFIDQMTEWRIFKDMKSERRIESIRCIYTVHFSEPSELSAVKDVHIYVTFQTSDTGTKQDQMQVWRQLSCAMWYNVVCGSDWALTTLMMEGTGSFETCV